MNILKKIWNWFCSLFKRGSSDSPIEEGEEQIDVPVVEETEPKLTISEDNPSGGNDSDVWVKYHGGE